MLAAVQEAVIGKVLCCGDALAALAVPCESMIASQLVEHGRLSGDVAKLH